MGVNVVLIDVIKYPGIFEGFPNFPISRCFLQELANLIDWWAEGVILPSICTVGIIGKIIHVIITLFYKRGGLMSSFYIKGF